MRGGEVMVRTRVEREAKLKSCNFPRSAEEIDDASPF